MGINFSDEARSIVAYSKLVCSMSYVVPRMQMISAGR